MKSTRRQSDQLAPRDLRRFCYKGRIPSRLLRCRLPPLFPGTTLAELALPFRARQFFEQKRYVKRPASMAKLTLGDLANVRGLGLYSIADIVEALYRCADARGVDSPQLTRKSKTNSRKADIVPPDVRACFERLGRMPLEVRNCRLPPIPPGVTLSDLRLTGRALWFFEQGGYLETPLALAKQTIADLLNQTGLGVLTVIEIAEALHRCAETRRKEATLDEEVLGWLVPKGVLLRRQIVARRFGLGGWEAQSLTGIGESYGYTRERIRQLCSPPLAPPTSLLRRYETVVEAVCSSLPAPAAELENRLVRHGFLDSGTKLKAILRVAQLLNREAGFVLEGEGPNCLATRPLTDAAVRMRGFLMRLSQASPVMQVEHLCRRWNASGRPPLDVRRVESGRVARSQNEELASAPWGGVSRVLPPTARMSGAAQRCVGDRSRAGLGADGGRRKKVSRIPETPGRMVPFGGAAKIQRLSEHQGGNALATFAGQRGAQALWRVPIRRARPMTRCSEQPKCEARRPVAESLDRRCWA